MEHPTRYRLVRSEILRAANRASLERGQLRIPNGPPSLTAGLLKFPFVGEAGAARRESRPFKETIHSLADEGNS